MLVETGKRITARHIKRSQEAGLKTLEVPDEYLVGRTLGHDVVAKDTGEVLAPANTEIDTALLAKFRQAGIKRSAPLYVNDLDNGPYISTTLNIDQTRTAWRRWSRSTA